MCHAPLKPLRDDSALRALWSLRGLRGASIEIRVNRNHAPCYISYLDTIGGGGWVCLSSPYTYSGEHFNRC